MRLRVCSSACQTSAVSVAMRLVDCENIEALGYLKEGVGKNIASSYFCVFAFPLLLVPVGSFSVPSSASLQRAQDMMGTDRASMARNGARYNLK